MNRTLLSISIAAIALTAISTVLYDQLMPVKEYQTYDGELPYVPSDITKANDKFIVNPSTASWKTEDISKIKQTVIFTFRGTVTDIGNPIDWSDNVGVVHGAIPITIDIVKNTKDVEGKKYEKGDSFTFYVDSTKVDGNYHIGSYEPEFEVAEDVIVHIAKSQLGPNGENGDNYFVELGEFGKYKIMDNKAYNEKSYQGKSIDDALKESQ